MSTFATLSRPARSASSGRAWLATCCVLAGLLAAVAGCGGERVDQATGEAPAAPETFVEDPTTLEYAGPIEKAHSREAWRSKEAVSGHLVAEFGGKVYNQGTLLFKTDLSRSRLELADGTTLVFDGRDAWVSPSVSVFQRARFHLRAWPYLLALPAKLRDHGTRLEPLGERELQGETYDAARLTFEPGIGDTPDDWYIIYRDPTTDRVRAVACISTYDKPALEAEQEPRAYTYDDYVELDGIPVPTRLTLWSWNREQGIQGEPVGHITFSDLAFTTPGPDAFNRPADSVPQPR